jgi:hypothetical protein
MEQKKPCIACGQEIALNSSLCSVCESYQRSWKNHLQYIAGIATLTALTISAIFWLGERVRSTFFSREKVVLAACNNLATGALVANRGDREVFISHLTLWMTGRTSNWSAPVLQINEKVEPGQFLQHSFPPGKITEAGTFARGLSSEDFEKLIVRASNNDPCVEAEFFSLSDSMLKDLTSAAGPTLNTFPVGGYLEYWGEGESPKRMRIDGIGVIRQAVPPCPLQSQSKQQ